MIEYRGHMGLQHLDLMCGNALVKEERKREITGRKQAKGGKKQRTQFTKLQRKICQMKRRMKKIGATWATFVGGELCPLQCVDDVRSAAVHKTLRIRVLDPQDELALPSLRKEGKGND